MSVYYVIYLPLKGFKILEFRSILVLAPENGKNGKIEHSAIYWNLALLFVNI